MVDQALKAALAAGESSPMPARSLPFVSRRARVQMTLSTLVPASSRPIAEPPEEVSRAAATIGVTPPPSTPARLYAIPAPV